MDYTIVVTEQEIHFIAEGLTNLPYKFANPLLQKIQGQINKQEAPKETAPVQQFPQPVPEEPEVVKE